MALRMVQRPPSYGKTTAGGKRIRFCRTTIKGIKECQCGTNKIIYDVKKAICYKGQLYISYDETGVRSFYNISTQPDKKITVKVESTKNSKRGIAWPMENNQDSPEIFIGGKVTWIYNWTPKKTDKEGDLEFVPMLWNANGADRFVNELPDGTKAVLGFNEPERKDQASMTPIVAARVWKEFIQPLAEKGIRLGSPSIASTNEGLNWLKDFLNELEKLGECHIDFLALHWYGQGVDGFIGFLTKAHEQLGDSRYPVWVTEFGCTSWKAAEPASQEEINGFMTQSMNRLDELDWIERYSWFGAQRHINDENLGSGICLIGQDGQLSDLGRKYMNE